MNRSLLVAALATLAAGSALAQSSVTVYGRFNVTLERQKLGNDSVNAMVNNASRIGFKGSEEINKCLKAGFVLEHGFNVDTGTTGANFWGRQSEVNLGGDCWGMLRMGRYTSEAYFATADYISMHNHDTGPSSDALYAYLGRDVNKVAYRSPSFGGATVEVATSLKETSANATYDVAFNWQGGPLHLGAGYQKDDQANQYAVRALFEAGAITLGAYAQRDKNVYAAGSRNNLRVSGMYTMGKAELHLNVGHADSYSKVSGSSASQWTLGYNYNLSKRTKLYGYYTKVDDDKKLYTGDFKSLAVGMRHNF